MYTFLTLRCLFVILIGLVQCERGSPLRVGEEAQRCHSQMQCPSSHECKMEQGVCCPRKRILFFNLFEQGF